MTVLGVVLGMVFIVASGWAGELCEICGTDIDDFSVGQVTITLRDRSTVTTCSMICAGKVLEEHGHGIRKINAIDYSSGKTLDARKAYFVTGSSVETAVHTKSRLAFLNQRYASRFISRYGGYIRDYHATLKNIESTLEAKEFIPKLNKSKDNGKCFACHEKIGKRRR